MNRAVFFAAAKGGPFRGALSQAQVSGMDAILDGWEESGLSDLRWLAYALATALGEVGAKMQPVREGFKATDAESRAFVRSRGYSYANEEHGHVWYGRGFAQVTWYDNYLKMERLLGIPLTKNPDLALDPKIAARIMFKGMELGIFRNRKFSDYFNDARNDPVNARNIINGRRQGETLPDRAEEIAGYYRHFYGALLTASVAPLNAPVANAATNPQMPTGQKTGIIAAFFGWLAAAWAFVMDHPLLFGLGTVALILLITVIVRKFKGKGAE